MLKRRLKLVLKVLLASFVLLFIFLLFERVRGQISLARYKQKLISQGEKLSPQDFAPRVSDPENGAPEAISAIERLERGVVLPHNHPPVMKLAPSGRAIVGFRESEWVETGTYRDGEWVNKKVTNHWDQLAADLKTNAATLDEIRAALDKPALNNKVDLSQGMKMKFSHLAPAKSLTFWLGGGSQLALHEGRTHDALEYLLVQVRLPRLLSEDRIVISELVRIAIGAIGKADTWEALQADGWTDEDLTKLQKTLESQEFARAMVGSLEGERVFCDVSYAMMRGSNQNARDALFGLEEIFGVDNSDRPAWETFLKKQVYCRIWRFSWSHQDQRHSLETMQRLIEIARTAVAEKSFSHVQDAITRFDQTSLNKSFYDKLRYPDPQSLFELSRSVNRAMKAETERSATICAVALKRYRLRHGKFPASLDALVPEILSSAPIDYMDGKPLKYRVNGDGSFALYSVSEDGKDDGGDMSPTDAKATRNLWTRRDYVWPSPALPEEIEAYRKEAAKN